MIEKTCCFTGHRQIEPEDALLLEERLEQEITKLCEQGVSDFLCGGALGFDTLAACVVLRVKKRVGGIRLVLILPCHEQTKGWPAKDVRLFETIKEKADEIIYTAQRYYPGCMHKRNRYLVLHSAWCICYLKKDTGGSAFTVSYAYEQGLTILNLYLSLSNQKTDLQS